MKKVVLIVLSVLGLSSAALADTDYGLEVGIRQQSGDATATGVSSDSQNGIQFGGFAHFQIFEKLHIRTGMLYTQRPLLVKSALGDEKLMMTYLDIPVALMYKFEEGAGIYGGISLANKLDATSDGAVDPSDVKTPLVPLIFGAFFKFHPNFGVNIYYESASGKVADSLENYRAVGANLMITFD
jgi:hypothetical protein